MKTLIAVTLSLLLFACSKKTVTSSELDGYEACFLMSTLDGKTIAQYDSHVCDEPLPPCSTFKIPNSLVSLEAGVVDTTDVLPYDGTPQHIGAWSRDHDMASAMKFSVLWYYQELARRVGEQRMQEFLQRIDYGNEDISAGIDSFWLDSSLQITAREQLDFISRFYRYELPVDARTVTTVQDLLVLEEKDTEVFAGKTGTCLDPRIGWFVGYAQNGNKEHVFVTVLHGEHVRGATARNITRRTLVELGALPTDGL